MILIAWSVHITLCNRCIVAYGSNTVCQRSGLTILKRETVVTTYTVHWSFIESVKEISFLRGNCNTFCPHVWFNFMFLVRVWPRQEFCSPQFHPIWPGFEPMTSRSLQYTSCPFNAHLCFAGMLFANKVDELWTQRWLLLVNISVTVNLLPHEAYITTLYDTVIMLTYCLQVK